MARHLKCQLEFSKTEIWWPAKTEKLRLSKKKVFNNGNQDLNACGPKGLCEQGSTNKQKVAVDVNVCLRLIMKQKDLTFRKSCPRRHDVAKRSSETHRRCTPP